MRRLQVIIQKQIMPFLLVAFSFLFTLSGCSLMEVHKQTQAAENVGYIKGNIKVNSDQKGPVIVLRFRDEKGLPLLLEAERSTSSEGDFLFPVDSGTFYIAAFIDVNKDRVFQPEEHGNYYGIPSQIEIASNQTVTLDTITISGPVPKLETDIKPIARFSAAWTNIGQIVSLNDPRFNRNNYTMGLWKPLDFLAIAEGGVFFLEEYQKDKIPVLFIHGVLDGPTLWSEVIENLDKQNFQPWVAYYPSGLRLDMISDYLTEAITRLQDEHDFNEFVVIAHSMGGLVTRSFVKKYVERAPENSKMLKLVMTINSPMEGMSSASSGVKHSPIVIPSWRDVMPGSDFLKGIHTWNWPKDIPYHLVASYINGASGDGLVTLQSQIPQKLQSESTRMYIFNSNHVGTINDKNFLTLFNKILSADHEN